MLVFLPAGFAGFMVAGLFAAYRSTLETHLNWGTSYLVHDLYRRFIGPGRDERHYVLVGRIVTVIIMIVAGLTTTLLDNAKEAFDLLLSIGAGTGLVYLLRWFWWRINAWTEVSAMAASFLVSATFFALAKTGHAIDDSIVLLSTVSVTTVVWIATTFLTPPVDDQTLDAFYLKVRPAGPGWERVRRRTGAAPSPDSLPQALLGWVLGLASIYSALFGTGAYLYGHLTQAIAYTVIFVLSVICLVRLTSITWSAKAAAAEVAA
jgi:Na+/proline symporter